EVPLVLLAGAFAEQAPTMRLAFDTLHAGCEAVMPAQVEVLCVVAKVLAYMAMVRVGRHRIGHGNSSNWVMPLDEIRWADSYRVLCRWWMSRRPLTSACSSKPTKGIP